MVEKEGGDSEKKMTKDFLDRWKKIASKYEGPEDSEAPKKAVKESEGAPARTTEQDLDQFLAEIATKGEAAPGKASEKRDQKDLDELLADFGLEEEEAPAAAKPAEPPVEVKPPKPPAPTAQETQDRVMETLKKVGLVGASAPAKPAERPAPAPEPAPSAPSTHADEEEDSLMLELESLLIDEGHTSGAAPDAATPAPPKREVFEEEDLIAELEGLLEGAGEEEEPAPPAPAAPAPKAPEPALAAPPVKKGVAAPASLEIRELSPPKAAPAAIMPPQAAPARPVGASQTTRPGRVNGGRVNGGRVNGGRVNGGRVNGGRVNGGRVNGGRESEGRVNGGRVNGGRVNGGRVNGGRVNGGRVNGGRVNGGRVNGGRVNGGRVNGGRIPGSRTGLALPPILRQQNRRSRIIQYAVAAVIFGVAFGGLLSIAPLGGGPRGPAADGDLSDWAGTGALLYTDAQDSNLPPALDLREYAIRSEGSPAGRLWFEATTAADLFSRQGSPFPGRGDLFVLLVDTDGSAATGYAYHDMGVDRVVEVTGWDGQIKSTATKAWGTRPTYDYAGFDPVGGLQVAVKQARIEGLLTSIPRLEAGARAAFEIHGIDANGVDRSDSTPAPASLRGASIAASVTPVSPGLLQPGSTADTPLLSVRVWNPSPISVDLSALRLTARYGPTAPAQGVGASLWRDANQNGVPEPGGDTKLSAASNALPPQTPTTLSFTPIPLAPGASVSLLATIDQVPAALPAGSSVMVSLDAPSDVTVSGGAIVNLQRMPVAPGAQPGAYVAAPPAAVAVDGITLDWAGRPSVVDASDIANPSIDLTQLSANATVNGLSVLVSFSSAPIAGAVVPLRLPSTQVLPSTGGGSQGPPAIYPPNLGTDVVFVMVEADNDAGTGFLVGSHGYDYAIRVEGKDGQPLAGGAKLLRWDTAPSAGWSTLPQVPSVGLGSNAMELGALNPPFALVARNITVTAYATDWQGLRDDMAAPLIISYSQGSRGELDPQTPSVGRGGEPAPPALNPIPEFQDALAPIAGVLAVVGLSRRRRRSPTEE